MAKVALFISSLEGGGAERVMVTLANQFAEHGHQVDFLLRNKIGVYLSEVSTKVNLIDLRKARMVQCFVPLVHYLRTECPVGILSSLPYPNMLNILAARLVRTKASVVVREANTPSMRVRSALPPKDRIIERLSTKLCYPYANWVVAVSRGVQRDLYHTTRVPRERIVLIYNPSYTARLLQLRDQPVDHPWFAPGQPPVVLGVGRFYPHKGFATLLKAFALVRANRPARLVLLGEGPLRAELETLAHQLGIADQVSMPGFVENPFAYMRRAAVFVLPSEYEGLPNVLIQAMACGCPVVSTNCPSGPEDILDNGKYGHLVPVGDVQAMADAILRVLNGDAPLVPEEWLWQFHEERVAKQYLQLLLNHTQGRI
jgi:glycosyltransferase involved in cell wall biosynthesis